jgi:NAD+ synthase
MRDLASSMAEWLRARVHEAGARGIVLGLSGGIDSAVVARVSQIALPGGVMTVIMPADSDPQDAADAQLVAETFDLPVMTIDLARPLEALLVQTQQALGTWPPGPARDDEKLAKMAQANLKPRLRMTTLYYVANRLNHLVAGTGNRTEIAIGYYTKYGDGGVDLLPLGALVKSQVRALARELGVPARVIDKPPSAGLWAGQTDEGEMGFTYAEL